MTVNTVQEGLQFWILLWKRTKTKGPGCPHRMTKVMRTPIMAYGIEEWMQG